MSSELVFVTSNLAKFSTASEIFAAQRLQIARRTLEVDEIQGADCVEVAIAKARALRPSLPGPLFVEDGSFHIEALGGFPGVYTRYALSTIGIEGFLKLLDGRADRGCFFQSAVVHCDVTGRIQVFVSKREGLSVSLKVADSAGDGWSDIWRILEIKGPQGPLPVAAAPADVAEAWKRDNAFRKLAQWLATSPAGDLPVQDA